MTPSTLTRISTLLPRCWHTLLTAVLTERLVHSLLQCRHTFCKCLVVSVSPCYAWDLLALGGALGTTYKVTNQTRRAHMRGKHVSLYTTSPASSVVLTDTWLWCTRDSHLVPRILSSTASGICTRTHGTMPRLKLAPH